MIRILFSILIYLICTTATAQQMQIEIIDLNNRMPEELITVIRPILVPGGSVSGSGNTLIIKTTPANLRDIRNILANIDKPSRRLLITVSQGINTRSGGSQQSYTGRIGNDEVSISSGNPDESGNRIEYRAVERYSNDQSRGGYTVQALEGEPAYISSGTSVPLATQTTQITPSGTIITQTTQEYRDVNSGFYVLPRLNGDRVTLSISTHLSGVNSGQGPAFNIQNVQTTVSGRLGEWLEIGGISQIRQSSNSATLSTGQFQTQESRPVLIKVEEIR